MREYEREREAFENSAPVVGPYSIGQNGDFAHILIEDVHWRTLSLMRQPIL
jgi:hypothetical protein